MSFFYGMKIAGDDPEQRKITLWERRIVGKHIEIEHRVGQTAENGGNAGHSHRVLLAKEVVNN